MKTLTSICMLLCKWSVIARVNGSCGYPGTPLNGSVHISFDSRVRVAHYTCHTSLIEGSLTRRCDESGRWNGTLPLCAWNAPIQHIEAGGIDAKLLNDQNSQTCDWLKGENELNLKLGSTSQITSVTLISPVPYKDLLQSSQFELTVIDGERATGKTNGTFYESIVTDDQFSSRRWSLNNTGRELSLKLLTGNVFLCEVVVQTYPKECGDPELPVYGNASVSGHQAVYYCDSRFTLTGDVERNCFDGKWTGKQPICTVSSVSNALPSSLVIAIVIAILRFILDFFVCIV